MFYEMPAGYDVSNGSFHIVSIDEPYLVALLSHISRQQWPKPTMFVQKNLITISDMSFHFPHYTLLL
jgi:hypothetical protein